MSSGPATNDVWHTGSNGNSKSGRAVCFVAGQERPKMTEIIQAVTNRDPNEMEFQQAVSEVISSVRPVLDQNSVYRESKILERLIEPERVITFRVPWMDDRGEVQVNRGYRVEMNSAIGPYKGGCGSILRLTSVY